MSQEKYDRAPRPWLTGYGIWHKKISAMFPSSPPCSLCRNQGTLEGCPKCSRTKGNEHAHAELNAKPKKKLLMPCACGNDTDYRDCWIHKDTGPRKGWMPPMDESDVSILVSTSAEDVQAELNAMFNRVWHMLPTEGSTIRRNYHYTFRNGKWHLS